MSETIYKQSFKNIPSAKSLKQPKKAFEEATKKLRQQIKNRELPAIDVVFGDADLEEFKDLAKPISFYQKILVLGVGGSSLGGRALSALKHEEATKNKLEFLESIDPVTVKNCLAKIDLKNTFFLVISKSGETIETICQTLVIVEEIKKTKIKNYSDQFLFITESQTNSIAKIAKKIGAKIVLHPEKIGGRYSCFSIVGMLPAIIAGLDAKKIRNGAKKIIGDFFCKQKITNSCAIQLELYQQGFTGNVVMPYVDNLKNFTNWYRQLWAESLGKNSFGSVPINSMGTIDQHSQLQLYLEGPKDKFFTFITQKKSPYDFSIKDLEGCKTLFGNKKLSQIVKIEQDTTIATLNQKKLPIRIFAIEKLDEEVLGALMMQMFLETILIAYAKNIDPFSQPAVELRKNLAKKLLMKNG